MLFSLWSKSAIIILLITGIGAAQAFAQNTKTPFIEKGVFWFDKDSGTEAYLFPGKNNYRLTVVSKRDVKVTYRTEINSLEPVAKELTLTGSAGGVRYFDFEHHFTKMTIWMSLEFTVDGKKIPALTRTFYNSIFESVEPENYFNPSKKKTN